MTTVQAYAALKPGGELKPFEYELGSIGPNEVDIKVESCGICHSDLSMLNNDWDMSKYPLVPGHEVIGAVQAVGEQVSRIQKGDLVGLGWHSGYCMSCDECMGGQHNLCSDAQGTIVERHGGFANLVRAKASSVFKIPKELDAKKVGPLLCGGITVFNPLIEFNVPPTSRVGIIGIGGLGHMALKFASAWGCHVTAFTSSDSKIDEALKMGAHETLNSKDKDAIQKAKGTLDFLISTVNVDLDWDTYITTLKPGGRLHMLGAVTKPIKFSLFPFILGQKEMGGSPVGSPKTIRQMLEFAARHDIVPTTEHFEMSQVNEALEHLKSGQARYRIVLDRS